MNILIDLIAYLMRQAAQSRDAKAPTRSPQIAVRQRATPDQIRTMQQYVPGGKRIGASPKGRTPISRPPMLPTVPSPTLTPPRAMQAVGSIPVVQRRPGPLRAKAALSMRLPFILGEVLSAPVALRKPEL